MLELLKINNVALIKNLEINFSNGFNVILGETGAGKSIIIDALNFVLGDKSDKTLIRAGEENMKVSAKFTSTNQRVLDLLDGIGIECERGEILLTRSYSQQGRGDARINGEIVTISTLREVGSSLVDAYSQNESVALLKQKNHLSILDSYKPFELKEIKSEIEEDIEKLNKINRDIKNLGGSQENRERQIDILRFQISEIEEMDIQKDEESELNKTLEKISHSEKIMTALSSANGCINGEENSALDLLKATTRSLSHVENYDEKISEICSRLNSLTLELEDVKEIIFNLADEYSFDENKLERLMDRRDKLNGLKRKYGGSLEKVESFLIQSKEELEKLENAEELLLIKQGEKKVLLDSVLKRMNKLWEIRKNHSEEIEKKIVEGLSELEILKAQFKVSFFSIVESIYDLESYSVNCLKDVEFLFSANLGEDLKPLAKTISGGEMSRFMLVFKNVIAEICGAETLILDEVDAGVSGKIANAVAVKIAKLSKNYQILCITHLPAVASMGDSFYFVSKGESQGRTETQIEVLSEDRVAEEIAILSYGNADKTRIDLTKEMIAQNLKFKK